MVKLSLPKHEHETTVHCCHACGGMMVPITTSTTFLFEDCNVQVCNIKAHKCTQCGEVVYSSAEAKRIEDALEPYRTRRNRT